MSQMTNPQRAMQFWSVLVMAARTNQVLTYEMVERMTGIPKFGMGNILGVVLAYCQRSEIPILTSIVVEKSTGRPADPLFNEPSFDLEAEQRRVFGFDWLKNGCPTLSEFQSAAQEETVTA
jgi:hypothetical protein